MIRAESCLKSYYVCGYNAGNGVSVAPPVLKCGISGKRDFRLCDNRKVSTAVAKTSGCLHVPSETVPN